jgi:hypothetical protein
MSSKFLFGGINDPYEVILLEYIQGASGGADGSYSMTISLTKTDSSPYFKLSFATSNRIMMTSIRVTLILIAQTIGSNKIGFFQVSAISGTTISPDFGISFTDFGYPYAEVNCLFGITSLNLILDTATPAQSMFSFVTDGSSITGFTQTSLNSVNVTASCIGVCPNGYSFVGGTCTAQCPAACSVCSSATVCT